MKRFKGKTALVTGASSGLGKDMAIQLAQAGCHLVLVARRENRLREMQHHLSQSYGINVTVKATDLSDLGACTELVHSLESAGTRIDLLINNAGFGYGGAFADQDWGRQQSMVQVNVTSLTYLTRIYASQMAERGDGDILLVSSVGGFTPCPGLAIYDATKAYVLVLGESLHYELKSKGVGVTTLCPGATRTEFFDVAGQQESFMIRNTMMTSEAAARVALKCMHKRRLHAIPGLTNKLAVWSLRLAPRCWMAPIANRTIAAFE